MARSSTIERVHRAAFELASELGSGAEEVPGLAVRVTGPASDARRTPELAAALRWLATRTP